MIPFDFEYYRPETLTEAGEIFQNLETEGKNPMYYGGGTEIISMARMSNIFTGAVIDIKEVPELKVMEFQDDHLVIGAGVTLTQIHEANLFPLLSQAGARVADHTIQNKITLGGNICSTIIYRETILPLLLADCEIVINTAGINQTIGINKIFAERLTLNRGELLTQVRIPQKYLSSPYVHIKRTKEDKIDYPLLTICALKTDKEIRAAFSGLGNYPFRSREMENELNRFDLTVGQRVDNAIKKIPLIVTDNLAGSADYRKFILGNLLISTVQELESSHVTNP